MRGKAAQDGETRIAPNGYHYTRANGKWELTHRLHMEKKLGRKLKAGEQVRFKDGNRKNLILSNYVLHQGGSGSIAKRRAVLIARIEELQAQLRDLENENS